MHTKYFLAESKKLKNLIIDKYTIKMRTYIGDIKTLDDGSDVTIKGWVQETRKIKNLMFIIIRDNTGSIQVTAKKDKNEEL
jgi:Aspartyl/asparaginyl-tRNA synthetases